MLPAKLKPTSAAKGHELTVFHHDARAVVIDEVIGLWITMIPLYWYSPTGLVFLDFIMAFLVFRLLDIIKPFPARQLHDKLPGGWGVMSYDVFSGAYGAAIIYGIVYFWGDHMGSI